MAMDLKTLVSSNPNDKIMKYTANAGEAFGRIIQFLYNVLFKQLISSEVLLLS